MIFTSIWMKKKHRKKHINLKLLFEATAFKRAARATQENGNLAVVVEMALEPCLCRPHHLFHPAIFNNCPAKYCSSQLQYRGALFYQKLRVVKQF
jgi:hypothetical protein